MCPVPWQFAVQNRCTSYLIVNGLRSTRDHRPRLEEEVNAKYFYRCQRNIIVNYGNIRVVDIVNLTVLFENGMVAEVSPKKIHKLGQRVQNAKAKIGLR